MNLSKLLFIAGYFGQYWNIFAHLVSYSAIISSCCFWSLWLPPASWLSPNRKSTNLCLENPSINLPPFVSPCNSYLSVGQLPGMQIRRTINIVILLANRLWWSATNKLLVKNFCVVKNVVLNKDLTFSIYFDHFTVSHEMYF